MPVLTGRRSLLMAGDALLFDSESPTPYWSTSFREKDMYEKGAKRKTRENVKWKVKAQIYERE
jgi:hypothetical protein